MIRTLMAWCFLVTLAPMLLVGCGGDNATPAGEANAVNTPAPAPVLEPPPVAAAPAAPAAPTADGEMAWVGQGPEPFDVKAFLASRTEPADNAAPLYKAAMALIDSSVGGEEAKPLETEINGTGNFGAVVSGSTPQARGAETLSKAASAIQKLDEAQAKPQCLFVTEFHPSALLGHVQASRTVTKLSILGMHEGRQTGDFRVSEAAFRRGLRMTRDIQPLGHLVSQLISIANESLLLSGVETILLKDSKLTAEQCDQILKLLIEHDQQSLNRLDEGLKVEYISSRNTIDDLQSGKLTLQQLVEQSGMPKNMAKLPSQPTPSLDFAAALPTIRETFTKAIKDASGPYTPSAGGGVNLAQMMADAKTAAAEGNLAKVQASAIATMLTASLAPVKEAHFRAKAHLAGTQMLVALKRYKLAHESDPADLAAAAAESELKTVPTDPYSGESLKYVVAEGRPVIYSVGKDQQDDGGLVDWKSSSQPGDFLFVLGQPSLAPAAGAGKTASAPPTQKKSGKAPPKAKVAQTKTKAEAVADASRPPATADDAPEIRTWTSTAGTTIEAELTAVDGPNAVLKKKDGSEVRVPLSKLSKFDQQWIKNNMP